MICATLRNMSSLNYSCMEWWQLGGGLENSKMVTPLVWKEHLWIIQSGGVQAAAHYDDYQPSKADGPLKRVADGYIMIIILRKW